MALWTEDEWQSLEEKSSLLQKTDLRTVYIIDRLVFELDQCLISLFVDYLSVCLVFSVIYQTSPTDHRGTGLLNHQSPGLFVIF